MKKIKGGNYNTQLIEKLDLPTNIFFDDLKSRKYYYDLISNYYNLKKSGEEQCIDITRREANNILSKSNIKKKININDYRKIITLCTNIEKNDKGEIVCSMKNNKIRLTIVANKAFIHEDRINYWNTINELLFKEEILNFTYTYGWYKCSSKSIRTLFPNIPELQTRLILSEPTTFSFNYWFNKKYIIDKKSGMKQLVHNNYFSYDEIMNIYIQIIIILNQMIKYKLSIADLSIDDFAVIDTTNKLKRINKTGLPIYSCDNYWVYSFQNRSYYVPNLGFMVVLHDRFNQEENGKFNGRIIDEKNRYNKSNFEEWQRDENQIKILQKIYSSIKDIDDNFKYNTDFNNFIKDINDKILKDYDLNKKQIGGVTTTVFRKNIIPYEFYPNNKIDEEFKKKNKIKTCPYWEGAVKLDNNSNNLYKIKIPLEYSNDGEEGIDFLKINRFKRYCPHLDKYQINTPYRFDQILRYKDSIIKQKSDDKNNLFINIEDENHFSIYDHSFNHNDEIILNNNDDDKYNVNWYYLKSKDNNEYENVLQNIKLEKSRVFRLKEELIKFEKKYLDKYDSNYSSYLEKYKEKEINNIIYDIKKIKSKIENRFKKEKDIKLKDNLNDKLEDINNFLEKIEIKLIDINNFNENDLNNLFYKYTQYIAIKNSIKTNIEKYNLEDNNYIIYKNFPNFDENNKDNTEFDFKEELDDYDNQITDDDIYYLEIKNKSLLHNNYCYIYKFTYDDEDDEEILNNNIKNIKKIYENDKIDELKIEMFNSNKIWLGYKDSMFELTIPNSEELILHNIIEGIPAKYKDDDDNDDNKYYWYEEDKVDNDKISLKEIQKNKNDYSIKVKRTKSIDHNNLYYYYNDDSINDEINYITINEVGYLNNNINIGFINNINKNVENDPNLIKGFVNLKNRFKLSELLETINYIMSNKQQNIYKSKAIKEREIFHKSDTEKINTFKFKKFKKKMVENNIFAKILNHFLFFRNNKIGQTLNLNDFRNNFMEGENVSYRLTVDDFKIGMQIAYRIFSNEIYILAEVVKKELNNITIEYFEWDEDLGQRKEPLKLITKKVTLDSVKPNRNILINPMFLKRKLEDGTLINFENKVNNIIYI